jgi:membrane protein implicated in regulation of membrane protease activity
MIEIYALFLLIIGFYLILRREGMLITGALLCITGITIIMISITDIADQSLKVTLLILLFLMIWLIFLVNYIRTRSANREPIRPEQMRQ